MSQSTGANTMTITVNGSLCSSATSSGYLNKPCVSVTVCKDSSCSSHVTINDILLDTASYGLRIFKQPLDVPASTSTPAFSDGLTQVDRAVPQTSLTCAGFATMSLGDP